MRKNSSWLEAGFEEVVNLANVYKERGIRLFQLQSAILYLKGVHLLRDLLLYQIILLGGVFFLSFGVVIIQGAAIFYLPFPPQMRLYAAIGTGLFNILVSWRVLGHFLSSKRWLKQASKYHGFLNDFMEGEGQLRRTELRRRTTA